MNGFLPPHELVAPADAVESGHREGQDVERASRTAEVPRRLGTDPVIGLLRPGPETGGAIGSGPDVTRAETRNGRGLLRGSSP
ncbi:hypothetical protein ACFQ08_20605 [Streptosporangium algeriense]|uniref:Uncharacterized protein n=1 Tax=Streptosporangium algeriense TaxID=1682748 RepID=A0ABW3DT05_9ACTN